MDDWVDTLCEESYTCVKYIFVLSNKIDVEIYQFGLMLLGTIVLQWFSNYVWTQESQTSRELLQKPLTERGGCCGGLLRKAMLWTLVSTLIWIAKIVLIMGNNVWVYGAILVGNLFGTWVTQSNQVPDHHYLADDIVAMMKRRDESDDVEVKKNINTALGYLKTAIGNPSENSRNSLFF